MKVWKTAALALCALSLTLGAGATGDARSAAAAEPVSPLVTAALHSLREARRELEAAPADKNGHRDRALEATVSAIRELEAEQGGK